MTNDITGGDDRESGRPCATCEGDGRIGVDLGRRGIDSMRCPDCHGSGVEPTEAA